MSLNRIKRSHVLKFRDWRKSQINDKIMGESTGKHCFYRVRAIFHTANQGLRLGLEGPFAGMVFSVGQKSRSASLKKPSTAPIYRSAVFMWSGAWESRKARRFLVTVMRILYVRPPEPRISDGRVWKTRTIEITLMSALNPAGGIRSRFS